MKYFYCYIFLLLLILISLYMSLMNKTQEQFTPGIRRLYRPYVRSARIFSESFFQSSNNSINSFFRKIGLY